jgi:hypothetical protein
LCVSVGVGRSGTGRHRAAILIRGIGPRAGRPRAGRVSIISVLVVPVLIVSVLVIPGLVIAVVRSDSRAREDPRANERNDAGVAGNHSRRAAYGASLNGAAGRVAADGARRNDDEAALQLCGVDAADVFELSFKGRYNSHFRYCRLPNFMILGEKQSLLLLCTVNAIAPVKAG